MMSVRAYPALLCGRHFSFQLLPLGQAAGSSTCTTARACVYVRVRVYVCVQVCMCVRM